MTDFTTPDRHLYCPSCKEELLHAKNGNVYTCVECENVRTGFDFKTLLTPREALFIDTLAELTERYRAVDVVMTLHACVKLRREMDEVVSIFAFGQAAKRDGLATEPLIAHSVKKRLGDLKQRRGINIVECCLTVFGAHETLKNEVEGAIARFGLQVPEVDGLLLRAFPFEGYAWQRMGAERV